MTLPAGSALQASNDAAALIDAGLCKKQKSSNNLTGEVLHFVRRTGRAELDKHAQPVTTSECLLSMNPLIELRRDEMLRELLAELQKKLPGVDVEAEQPLAHLISHMLWGTNAQALRR